MINHNILHKISIKGFALHPHPLSKLMKPIFKLCYDGIRMNAPIYFTCTEIIAKRNFNVNSSHIYLIIDNLQKN